MSKYNIVRRDANKSYGIYKIGPGCHRIVKNLKDYSDEKEAIGDLMKLLDGEITEQELLSEESIELIKGKYTCENFYRCPKCGSLSIEDKFSFCPSCGGRINFKEAIL